MCHLNGPTRTDGFRQRAAGIPGCGNDRIHNMLRKCRSGLDSYGSWLWGRAVCCPGRSDCGRWGRPLRIDIRMRRRIVRNRACRFALHRSRCGTRLWRRSELFRGSRLASRSSDGTRRCRKRRGCAHRRGFLDLARATIRFIDFESGARGGSRHDCLDRHHRLGGCIQRQRLRIGCAKLRCGLGRAGSFLAGFVCGNRRGRNRDRNRCL